MSNDKFLNNISIPKVVPQPLQQRVDPRKDILPLVKVGSFTLSAGGTLDIDVGFSPKALWVKGASGSDTSDGFTDFTDGKTLRTVESLGATTASISSNLVSVGGTTSNVTKRLNNGFRLTTSYSSSVSCIYLAIG